MFFALGGACLGEVVGEVMAQLAWEPQLNLREMNDHIGDEIRAKRHLSPAVGNLGQWPKG